MSVACTAKVKSDDVIVGRGEGNKFSLEIEPTSDERKDVIVRLEIPYGENQQGKPLFLLEDENARPKVSYRLSAGNTPLPIDLAEDGAPKRSENCIAWDIPSGITIAANSTMQIDVTELGGTIPPGKAKVILSIRQTSDAAFTTVKAQDGKELEVPVELKKGDEKGVKIHYFDASNDYVLHAGEEEAVLSFFATGAKEVTLFKNNTEIWPPPGGSQDLFFKDKPSITSVYRLEAKGPAANDNDNREKLLKDGNLVVRFLTVQVAQAGWNRQPLTQGYPTVLMKALSFASGEAERLYGVFVNPYLFTIKHFSIEELEKAVKDNTIPQTLIDQFKETHEPLPDKPQLERRKDGMWAIGVRNKRYLMRWENETLNVYVDPDTPETKPAIGLYSSATGFPPWKKEPPGKDFMEIESDGHKLNDMSHSPGVASDGKLWLIGGSSVNPKKCSNEVWCYQKNERNENEWVRDKISSRFTERMGHCVVEFKNKIWVLGGLNGSDPLNDVWSYDQKEKDENKKWHQVTANAKWPARCLFAALVTPTVGVPPFDSEKIWIYGGTKDPDEIEPRIDLWSTTDGVNWEEAKIFELGPLPGQPNGATLLWADNRLHLAGSFKAGTREDSDNGATLSATVYSLCADRYQWEANPVSWGWEQFGGNPFLMRSLVFNRFWFFWSLYQKMTSVPKLNVFIPA